MQHVVRISDGLGNQMFQYAFAYALSRKTGAEVLIDPLFWGTSLRKYRLEEFCITKTKKLVAPGLDYVLGFGPRNGRKFKDLYRQWLVKRKYCFVREKEIMHYDKGMTEQTKPSFFSGFWQAPEYFEEYYEELKAQFVRRKGISARAADYLRQIRKEVSVACHIRRTDYVRQEANAALGFGFYEEALRQMQRRLGDFQLFIFTDDKEFVKRSFKLREYILVEELSDLDEFELMKECNHHIVANSTFSWWAAYLGENKGGIVYAPCVGIWSKEFYPREWNLLYTQTEE